MPSDDRTREALGAIAPARTAFRAAVAAAAEDVRTLLRGMRAGANGGTRPGGALGEFAGGRIDLERFDALFAHGAVLDAAGIATIERALGILEEIAGWGEDGYAVHVSAGHDLRAGIAAALAVLGRAFGAAAAVELVRTRRFDPREHAALLQPFPSERWNRAERRIAPPLVVEVDGGDLRAGGLAEFLDGTQKLVLVVRGDAPPAALVRAITPGILVAQIADAGTLADLASFDGPALIALVPETAALFVHDPRAGETLAQRLTVARIPETAGRGGRGTPSLFQREEELRQLRVLAQPETPPAATAVAEPVAPAAVNVAAQEADPAARLAALLLRQTDLSGL
jgi:hypothetical protein